MHHMGIRWTIAAVAAGLALAGRAQAAVVAVDPAPGARLGPGQYITLDFSPPMTQAELNRLDDLVEIRDERLGRMYWFAAGVGNAPYSRVVLVPDDNWRPGSTIRLEMMVDSSLASPTLQPAHFRWPFLCDGCEWLGTAPSWTQQLQGPASETLDLLPLDLNRTGQVDLVAARREQMVYFRVDTCAATPQLSGLGGMALPDWSLDRRLRPLSLGTSASGVLHPGEGLLLHTGGQAEGLRVLARNGPDNSPSFSQLLLEDGSFAGSPLLAEPVRLMPDHLCQDLLVATRGGDLVLFPARNDCSQIEPDSTRVLFSGLGTPLDIQVIQGARLAPGVFEDYVLVLDASPQPLHVLRWNGVSLDEVWNAPPDETQDLTRVEEWSDGDPEGLPDLIAWNGNGRVVVVRNLDPDNPQAQISAWTYPEPLRDVEALPDGRVFFAGFSTLSISFDPAAGILEPFADEQPAIPRRLRAADLNSDGDHDLLVLYEDGRVLAHLDEPVGEFRLALPDPPALRDVAVGDTLRLSLAFRHRGGSGTMRLDLAPPPADPAFPFTWPDLPPVDLEPGDSLSVELAVHPGAPVDSCWSAAEFNLLWSFPACFGQAGQARLDLCLQAGTPLAALSTDSLGFGDDCGGHEGCEPECPQGSVWLRNDGDAVLGLLGATLAAHPDDSLSAPESFCLLTPPPAELAPGDSTRLDLSFCPPMDGPWPWLQGALLEIRTRALSADSLLRLPLGGLLTCPWPPAFAGALPELVEDVEAWLDLEPLLSDPDNTPDQLALTLRVGILPVDDPPVFLAATDSLLTLREGGTLRVAFAWSEVDGEAVAAEFGLFRDEALTQPVEQLDMGDGEAWAWERPVADGDSLAFAGHLWWRARLADPPGGAGFAAERRGAVLLLGRRDTLSLREDEVAVVDLADWVLEPGADPAEAELDWLQVLGTEGLEPDSVLRAERLGGLLTRLVPGRDLNRGHVPGLALLARVLRPGLPARLDTVAVDLAPVDDPPALTLVPAPLLTVREGRTLRLDFAWSEVDGELPAATLSLARDEGQQEVVETATAPAGLAWSYERPVAEGDSALYAGRLYWRLVVADPPGGAGLLAEAAGLLRLTSRRDTLAMEEDRELVLDAGAWLLSPGEDPAGMTVEWLGTRGTGDVDPDEALAVEPLGGLLFRLTPGPDLNRDQLPGLSLLFQLQEEGAAARRDTLRVAIEPVDDAPRLLAAPDEGLELPEGAETLLGWEAVEVDGDPLGGGLLLSLDPFFGDTLAYTGWPAGDGHLTLAYRPEVGDSLRLGGRVHWRLDLRDGAPGAGRLLLERHLAVVQSPQHLQLNLRTAPPDEGHWGDTLRLPVRVFSATGYVGSLTLRLEQDLQEVERVDWPWLDLGAGATLDTLLSLALPLEGAQSCWTLTLLPGNPAEDEADNVLTDCLRLEREPLGPETRAFSPNGDGVNDGLRFHFPNRPARSGYRVEIFDAGGRRVAAHDLAGGERSWEWDGRLAGRDLLPGVYAWVQLDGQQVLAKGQLGVVR